LRRSARRVRDTPASSRAALIRAPISFFMRCIVFTVMHGPVKNNDDSHARPRMGASTRGSEERQASPVRRRRPRRHGPRPRRCRRRQAALVATASPPFSDDEQLAIRRFRRVKNAAPERAADLLYKMEIYASACERARDRISAAEADIDRAFVGPQNSDGNRER
jgi:hypothetical protein